MVVVLVGTNTTTTTNNKNNNINGSISKKSAPTSIAPTHESATSAKPSSPSSTTAFSTSGGPLPIAKGNSSKSINAETYPCGTPYTSASSSLRRNCPRSLPWRIDTACNYVVLLLFLLVVAVIDWAKRRRQQRPTSGTSSWITLWRRWRRLTLAFEKRWSKRSGGRWKHFVTRWLAGRRAKERRCGGACIHKNTTTDDDDDSEMHKKMKKTKANQHSSDVERNKRRRNGISPVVGCRLPRRRLDRRPQRGLTRRVRTLRSVGAAA